MKPKPQIGQVVLLAREIKPGELLHPATVRSVGRKYFKVMPEGSPNDDWYLREFNH